jgi:CRP/FNR family transcriptional regulator
VTAGALGKTYQDGEIVVRQGEEGDCLFVVQDGQLEVVREDGGKEMLLRVVGKDEIVGEMAIFERRARSATVRARGEARVLTLDRKNFLRRVGEDPTLAFRILETQSRRIRDLTEQLSAIRRVVDGRWKGQG